MSVQENEGRRNSPFAGFSPRCTTLKAGRAETLPPFNTDGRSSWNTIAIKLQSWENHYVSPHLHVSGKQPWVFGLCTRSARDCVLQSVCTTLGTPGSPDTLATQQAIRITIMPKACQGSFWGCIQEPQLCNASTFKSYDLKFPFRAR